MYFTVCVCTQVALVQLLTCQYGTHPISYRKAGIQLLLTTDDDHSHVRVSLQDFELGGKQDGSRMIVACVPTRMVWGHAPPGKILIDCSA